MNSMISLFIDNELSIEEKCLFLEKIRDDTPFFLESIQMLRQEILIRSDVAESMPQAEIPLPTNWMLTIRNLFRPAVFIPAAVVCVLLFLTILPANKIKPHFNRFVIYRPDVNRVEIVGSFTDWKRIPLQKISNSGYWEGKFELPVGEYRYTYILDGDTPFADPTVPTVEQDDFNGVNSIIRVVEKI